MVGLGHAQRALLGNIEGGMTAVKSAQCNLETKAELPPMGDDHVSLMENVYHLF